VDRSASHLAGIVHGSALADQERAVYRQPFVSVLSASFRPKKSSCAVAAFVEYVGLDGFIEISAPELRTFIAQPHGYL